MNRIRNAEFRRTRRKQFKHGLLPHSSVNAKPFTVGNTAGLEFLNRFYCHCPVNPGRLKPKVAQLAQADLYPHNRFARRIFGIDLRLCLRFRICGKKA